MALAPRTDNPAKDMAAIMAQARNYPDSRLADVLAGKDMSIPQYVAMAEAMGRRNLRQAVDGAQAQQQAQQPSVKEQLLAEQSAPQMAAGIDQLPAANMESMDLAGGGIIAFSGKDGSYVDTDLTEEEKQALRDRTDFLAGGKKLLASAADVVTLPARGVMGAVNTGVIRPIRATGIGLPYIPEEAFGGSSSSMTPYFDRYVRAQEQKDKNAADIAKVLEKPVGDQPGDYPVLPGQDALKNTPAAAAAAATPNSAINLSQPTTFERRASPFGQMSAEKVDVEGLKSRGLGEGLMRLSAGLLSAPGAKGVSAGIAGLAEQAGLTRKETNALKKDARDYDLNLKRAEAAFEQGQDELGFKFTEAANVNKYRMASLAQEPNEVRTLKAIAANPELAAIYKGGKSIESYSLKDATDAFNKLEGSKLRDLKKIGVTTPSEYRQFVITGLPPMQVVDTIPGKGDKVRS
jgi:hypothetical protein